MSKPTQLRGQDNYGSTFADPTDPNFTVRFKTNSGRKNLNGLSVDNYITEIIVNDLAPVVSGSVSATDALAVRVRISGSSLSHDRLKKIVGGLAAQLPAWTNENVILGFTPTTIPVNPAAEQA